MNNIEASLNEIDRAMTELGARGIQMFTNVAGKPLSAPEFRPIFRRMAEHDLPVWVHPMRGPQFPDYASEKDIGGRDLVHLRLALRDHRLHDAADLFRACSTNCRRSRSSRHHMGGMIPFFAGKIELGFRQIFFGTPERNPVAEAPASRSRRSTITRCSMPTRR